MLKKVSWPDCAHEYDRIRTAVRKGMRVALETENWATADKLWVNHW